MKPGIISALVATVAIAILGVIFSKENAVLVIGFCSVVCTSLLGLLKAISTDEKLDKVADKAEVAAGKVEEVKTALVEKGEERDKKLDAIAETGDKTHKLVNSAMTVQLKLNAVMSRRLADVTKTTEDEKAAELAESMLATHEANQPT